jgi:two-component system response regulator TctD
MAKTGGAPPQGGRSERIMARILVVEDDAALSRGLSSLIAASGHAVDVAANGQDALDMAHDEPYALIILDIGLPDVTGFDVLARLRQNGEKVPVLMLTARDTVTDKVRGLDLGADDYLLKPFDPMELEARMRALLRRSTGEASPVIQVGALSFDATTGLVTVNDREINLRRRERAVLERLIARPGKVVPKERLAAEVFNYDDDVAPNAIELYVARLRRKLEPDGPQIRTLRGLGYMLDPG